jgi:IclR family acetate operon transcriptional repressor
MMTESVQIKSVSRAVRLLMFVTRQPHGVSAAEAARACGLALSTAHHLLGTLVTEGMLAKDDRRRYLLGPGALVLADRVARDTGVPPYLLAPLQKLAEETGHTSYLAAWRGDDIYLLHWVEGANALRVAEIERGPYRMAHARATGKALLAFASHETRDAYLAGHHLEAVTPTTITERAAFEAELELVRANGWAEDHEEYVEGQWCLSAPVLVEDVLIAAISVAFPIGRFGTGSDQLREAVLRAAKSVAVGSQSREIDRRGVLLEKPREGRTRTSRTR